MTAAALVALHTDPSLSEIEQLKIQLQEAYRLSRSLRMTLLGVHTDATEALGPMRFERSVRSFKEGLRQAQETLDALEAKLTT